MGNDFVSGSFVIAISSIFCAGFGVLLAHCFRLKYSEIDLCGMRFTRDIALENQGYEIELEHPITPLGRDVIPRPSSEPPSRRGSLNNV